MLKQKADRGSKCCSVGRNLFKADRNGKVLSLEEKAINIEAGQYSNVIAGDGDINITINEGVTLSSAEHLVIELLRAHDRDGSICRKMIRDLLFLPSSVD